MKRKRAPTLRRGPWQSLAPATVLRDAAWWEVHRALPPELQKIHDDPDDEVFMNDLYTVTRRIEGTMQEGRRVISLSIRRNDRAPIHDWRDFQIIKNELLGPEAEALEIYPAESRLVDTANQYWLYSIEGVKLPFGFPARVVGEQSIGRSKQRPWRDDERPADCDAAKLPDAEE